MSAWETVIGLEVHARLLTRTKIFCRCVVEFGAEPNARVCPVCLGYPGALPVLNREAVHLAMRAALAAGCELHQESIFARKNYFYPDLPKGYQISQFDRPIATGGRLEIRGRNFSKVVRITRMHMEEDAGKLMHETPWEDVGSDVSLVDLNRAGTPLIEIVSEPEISSSEEAVAWLTRLRQVLMYAAVCNGNMEEGSLRCDANVSVRRKGEPLGTRAEVKNLNSFRFLARAIDFEVERQIALLESGARIVQETRLFDPSRGETRAMRSKEEAHDYRYFPEPDLLPLRLSSEWIEQVRSELPELPAAKIQRYQEELGVPEADAEVLVTTLELAEYYEETARLSNQPKLAANWVRNEVLGLLNEQKVEISEFALRPPGLARLLELIQQGVVSGKVAKEVFEEISRSGEDPEAIVRKRGLTQIDDPAVIRQAAESVIAANQAQVEQYRSGKAQVFGFLVGQLMKQTRGKAKADLANQILRELLDEGSAG
jgi:aspartyl-tRNA(Asn)/glutamyl-tRNA(Gln) amidotransferase subunit B